MGTDREIVRIAERRKHVVTDGDLERLGLNQRDIERAAADGILQRVMTGAYTTLARPELAQWQLAMCLTQPELVVSHSSAAAFWGLRRAPKDMLEVTVPNTSRLRRTPAVIHRSTYLPLEHIVETVDGLRVTSVPRTVFDLGGRVDSLTHRSMVEDARNRQLCSDAELADVYRVMRAKGRRGSAAWSRLSDITERVGRPPMSELELVLQDALVEAGLPPASQQHPIQLPSGRFIRIDLAYPDCRVALEVDHTAWHNTASAIENDKARDLELATIGWISVRFTERMLERTSMCVHQIRVLLELRTALLSAA